MKEIKDELNINIGDEAAQGAKKLQVEMKEAISDGCRTLKKEIAAALHISGRYDMELKADIARTKGYSRTLGEHIWKTDRDAKIKMEEL
jgi:hypothetical protein